MLAQGLYTGFSTKKFQHTKQFEVHDFELVKEDLLNHIFTRKGERVMMPNFGTRIPEMIFEPLDDITIDIINEDLTNVFSFDPRVRTLKLQVVPDHDNNAINVLADLYYVELNMTDRLTLNIQFENG